MRKKIVIKFLCLMLTILLALNMTGCKTLVSVIKDSEQEESAEFFNQDEDSVFVSKEKIMEYRSEYSRCNSTFYKDQLSGDDLYLYNALLYAMEHNYTGFYVYVEDQDMDPFVARECLSLDSPFLEQNYSSEETFYTYTDGSVGFYMDSFNEEQWDLKMEALEKAEKIVEGIPSAVKSDEDKMEYLYNYVCENVEYIEYEETSGINYLYDAMCKGESLCDGYSNMLMLLFNLAGIRSCEAMGDDVENDDLLTEKELMESKGHTWVVAMYDGEYYNFDPTYDADTDNDLKDYNCYFAVSDDVIDVQFFDHDDLRPVCNDTSRDLICGDICIDSLTKGSEIRKVAKFTDEMAEEGCFSTLLIYDGVADEEDVDAFAEEYIDTTEIVNYVTYSYKIDKTRTFILLETEVQ